MSLACTIIAQLMLLPLPNGGEAALAHGWINPVVGRHGMRPESELIASDVGQQAAAMLPDQRQREPSADCTPELKAAGIQIPPWAATGDWPQESTDERASIQFTNITVASNRRLAMVAWTHYRGPLNAGYHYAVLKLRKARWQLVKDSRYGPVW